MIDAIFPNPDNPRKNFDLEELEKLAQSIREVGVLQPVVVVINGLRNFKGEGEFRLVAGERRWRAAAMAGLEYIPAILKDLTLEQEAEIMLIENLQRQDLDPVEEAQAYRALLAMNGYTQESLGEKLGVSQGHIANRIRLLELPEDVQDNISRGIISASHGKVLAGYKIPETLMKTAVEKIVEGSIPVAKAGSVVSCLIGNEGKPLFDHYRDKPEFNTKKCIGCKHRVMGKASAWDTEEKPYCLSAPCWNAKHEEGHKNRVEKALKENVVDLSKLDYSSYNSISSARFDTSECKDCEHCKLGSFSLSGEPREHCMNASCFNKKNSAVDREKAKAARDEFKDELAEIKNLVAELAAEVDETFDCTHEAFGMEVLQYLAAMVLCHVSNNYDRKMTRYQYVKDKFGWTEEAFKGNGWGLIGERWPEFKEMLDSLSSTQLWEIIFEWPAVAEGLTGIRMWLLKGEETERVVIDPEPEADPVFALMGRIIKTHYGTGGIVTYVNGPKSDGSYTINYKEDSQDRKFCIINGLTVKEGVVLCEGIPLTILETEEAK
jgi:ParB/RepB/Spo0J family partition protein